MTPERLTELEQLEAAATPGPWGHAHGRIKEQDARLIAALRTDAKELLRFARLFLEASK